MTNFAVIDVPSSLGLRSSGVEGLPAALRALGVVQRLAAREGGRVAPLAAPDTTRDPQTRLLNGPALRDTMRALAQAVATLVDRGEVPLVMAGDCSVILGGLLGLRQTKSLQGDARPGLLFVDGHVDFYQPQASPTGEVADMDLALATGRGPSVLAELDAAGPLVRDEDVAAVGARDKRERDAAGSQDIESTRIHLFELESVRHRGMDTVASEAVGVVARSDLTPGFWLHLDADVLDDAVMPAVDYRQVGGLVPTELIALLRAAESSNRLRGISVAIYNPALDPAGEAGRILVDCLVAGLT